MIYRFLALGTSLSTLVLACPYLPGDDGVAPKHSVGLVVGCGGMTFQSDHSEQQPVPAATQPSPRTGKSISAGEEQSDIDINAKVAQLNIDRATLKDVIRVFGEPTRYGWGPTNLDKDNLPWNYILYYPRGLHVLMAGDRIIELRHLLPGDYVFRGRLRVGSSLDEVLDVIGQPTETVEGKRNSFQDGVLYKDINGQSGYCYYGRMDQRVRFFFQSSRVTEIYATRSGYNAGGSLFRAVVPISSVKAFDNVCWRDLSELDLSDTEDLPGTLWFNQKTVWPDAARMPGGCDPKKLLTSAKNPGLGVRELHRQGITGKGVNVAIIDQPTYLDHPEFAGKITAYHDAGCGRAKRSMHGPAVASLLVGTHCGTAPDARVYYVAAPSWNLDTAYQASALDWIVEQNEKLPAGKKIRVVSVSAAPSGSNSSFEKNQETWDEACARAEAADILVLDCTRHHGFIGACWLDASDPEKVAKCTPGYRGMPFETGAGRLLVPLAPRTTAEECRKGQYGFQYCGYGGLSWSIPYCAGVLAMGWQIRPELSPTQMRELLFRSAHETADGALIINPKAFIELTRSRSENWQKDRGSSTGLSTPVRQPDRCEEQTKMTTQSGIDIVVSFLHFRLTQYVRGPIS